MKHNNHMSFVALFVCSTCCVTNMRAEFSDFSDDISEVLDSDNSIMQEIQRSELNTYEIQYTDVLECADEARDFSFCLDENISDDIEIISSDIAMSDKIDSNDVANISTVVTQEEVVRAVVTQEDKATLEAQFDTMVDELVQAGAVRDEVPNAEVQPKWKALLARLGSYALSMGITCKQLVVNMYANVKNTVVNYWANKNNDPIKK